MNKTTKMAQVLFYTRPVKVKVYNDTILTVDEDGNMVYNDLSSDWCYVTNASFEKDAEKVHYNDFNNNAALLLADDIIRLLEALKMEAKSMVFSIDKNNVTDVKISYK